DVAGEVAEVAIFGEEGDARRARGGEGEIGGFAVALGGEAVAVPIGVVIAGAVAPQIKQRIVEAGLVHAAAGEEGGAGATVGEHFEIPAGIGVGARAGVDDAGAAPIGALVAGGIALVIIETVAVFDLRP